MRKVRQAVAWVVLLAAAAVLWPAPRFDAERILAQSKLSGRVFQGEVQEITALDGQVSAYLIEEHSVPMAVAAFGFDKAGRAYEPKEGVALLAEQVLLDGAGKYSRQELRNFMEERGIRLSVSAGQDRLSFVFSFVKEFEKDALDVLRAVLYEPQLGKEDLDLVRQQLAAVRKQQKEKPQYYLTQLVKENFYKTHPYGREEIPADEVLQRVTADDIRTYLRDYMARDTLNVGIAGDLDKAETEAFLTQAFAGLAAVSAGKELPEFKTNFTLKASAAAPYSAQSFVMLTAQGVKRLDKDFYPLYVADYIFGGSGLTSALNKELREENGLTYGIYSFFANSDAADLWTIYFSATPENAVEALTRAAAVYENFYQKGVSEAQLAQAKKGLLNSFNLRFAGLGNIAQMLEQMQAQKLGQDFLQKRQSLVEAVTLDAVNDAIRRRMPKSLNSQGGVNIFEVTGKEK